jgi:YidC/Oxa1 family membrane protein insertase
MLNSEQNVEVSDTTKAQSVFQQLPIKNTGCVSLSSLPLPLFIAKNMNSKLDKNTVVGMILLAVLFFVFFWYTSKQSQAAMEVQKHKEDSIAKLNAAKIKPTDIAAARLDSLKRDSANKLSAAGNLGATAVIGTEKTDTVETDILKILFTNKGGKIKSVWLKKYRSYDSSLVKLGNESDVLSYAINTSNTTTAKSDELFFAFKGVTKNADGSQTVTYDLKDAAGEGIEHVYTIKPDNYLIDWTVNMNGADKLLSNNTLNVQYKVTPVQHEKSASYEKQMSNVGFSEDGKFDYISSKKEHTFEKPTQWVAAVQQFFNVALVAKNNFNSGKVEWARNTEDSSKELGVVDAILHATIPVQKQTSIPFQLYFGPNDYHILKNTGLKMDGIVNLGRDMYSFVRPINEYIIMPVFTFFSKLVSNYGWVILLLTVFIRLVTSPLTYGSYLSGAKMKVLKPELDELKKKYGDDQQGYAMAQMKLTNEAGANPLKGCIPALVQLPIFVALYNFFNSNIAVRGQSFLWSHDLSVYDSIAHLPFNIPALGDHISLFTLTAVAGQFLISIYNLSSTPTQDNPAMKYMPYIFPFMMLFVFNRLPSALTWYYTVSNILTLLIQFVMQKYFIDHEKVLAAIQEKRKNPKTKQKSKFQERYEQMVESQKKLQEMKNKNQNKK